MLIFIELFYWSLTSVCYLLYYSTSSINVNSWLPWSSVLGTLEWGKIGRELKILHSSPGLLLAKSR